MGSSGYSDSNAAIMVLSFSQSFNAINYHGKAAWNLIPFAVYWTVWEEQNSRTFEDWAAPFHRLVELVLFKLFEWLSVGSPGFDIKFSSWAFDWDSLLMMAP